MKALAPNLPGRKPILFLINALRFLTTLYIAGFSIATLVVSIIFGQVGGIITSVYLIPASLALAALELGYVCSHLSPSRFGMHPVRIIALQFVGAMLAGVGCSQYDLFIPGCVAFGLTIGLMNLIGIYYLCWGTGGQEEGSEVWSLDCEQSGRAVFLMPGEKVPLFVEPGIETDRRNSSGSVSSGRSGPEVLSID